MRIIKVSHKIRSVRPPAFVPFFILLTLLLSACATIQKRPVIKVTSSPAQETTTLERLKITAKIKANESPSAKTTITVKAPDLIRIEVYGAMRRLVMVITGDKARCEYFQGGVIKECEWEDNSVGSELGYLPNPSVLVPFLLNTDGSNPRTIEVGGEGLDLKLSTKEYLDIGGKLSIPVNIKIEHLIKTISIEYREVEVNPIVDKSAFALFNKNDL